MASAALVNPTILQWARERAGLDLSVLARKMQVDESRVEQWEDGIEKPTFVQAKKLAKFTYVPFGYFYLEEPPVEKPLLPDLRTIGDHPLEQYSLNLKDTIKQCLMRQEWYREHQIVHDSLPHHFVGTLTTNVPAEEAVVAVRRQLNWPERIERGTSDEYFRNLVRAIENTGVLVMRSGMVGSNTTRLLDVTEFRGFAICDEYAPLIFINGRDSLGAQLFTLMHEYAHLWLGESGVSNGEPVAERVAEQWCNQLSAEFLVPLNVFAARWDTRIPWRENCGLLARYFHVSEWVVVRRAYENGKLSRVEYQAYVAEQLRLRREAESGGGSYNRIQKVKVSETFAKAVVVEALNGKMLLTEAHRLVGIKPKNLKPFAGELGL